MGGVTRLRQRELGISHFGVSAIEAEELLTVRARGVCPTLEMWVVAGGFLSHLRIAGTQS